MKLPSWLRWLLIGGGIFAVMAAGFVTMQTWVGGQRKMVALPGGVAFEYLGVVRGGETFTTEPQWQSALRRILPGAVAARLPRAFNTSVSYGNSNTVAVFYTLTDTNGAQVRTYPWQWYVAVGDDGFTFPLNGGSGSAGDGTKVYHHTDLPAYPRRQKDFELRFLDDDYQLVASLRVPNPAPGPFPVWQPEALPIYRTNGEMVVKLEQLAEGGQGFSTWVNARWKIVSAAPAWLRAKPEYQIYEDATGNQGGRLAFTEPAWKLTLPFHRHGWTNFAAAEKFRLDDLSVPAAGEFELLQKKLVCAGVNITIETVAAAGAIVITNGVDYGFRPGKAASGWSTTSDGRTRIEEISSEKAFFLIQTSQIEPGARIHFRLIAADGREIKMQDEGWSGQSGGGRRYRQKFDTTNQSDTVSLEIIVSRPRVFEFLVNPAEVQRITSAKK